MANSGKVGIETGGAVSVRRAALYALFAVVAAVVALAGSLAWLILGDTRLPVASTDVVVAQGSSVSEIGHLLEARGVVRDATLFDLYVRAHGGGDRIEAAEYTFAHHSTVAAVVATLLAGGRPAVLWITIPEGYTAAQIGRRLAQAGLVSESAFALAVRARSLMLGGVKTAGLEGYLFPDTYQIPRQTTADGAIDLMTQQFRAKLPLDYVTTARRLHFSVPQIVIIASMIEREAKVDAERPIIASVIYNRLRRGMPLEIDATVEYALPHYKHALSYADLAVDSPYNTYTHTGLPPTPISNPGRASLFAAFHPASTPFLYYVYKGNGRHEFSQTLQEQQANVRRYLR